MNIETFIDLTNKTFTQGTLKKNEDIFKLKGMLFDRHGLTQEDLINDFMGWYFEKELDKRFDPSKSAEATYILNNVRWYLLEKLRQEDLYRSRNISIDSLNDNGYSPELQEQIKDKDGVWRRYNFEDGGRLKITPEEEYIDRELIEILKNKLDVTWYEYFIGKITLEELAIEKNISYRWAMEQKQRIYRGLIKYLKNKGYTVKDLQR